MPSGQEGRPSTKRDIERLRGAYAAFNTEGVDALLERLAPEIHVQDRESQPDRETYHGLEEFEEMFRSIMDVFEDLVYEVEEVTAHEDKLVVVLHQYARGRSSGAPVECRIAHVWTMRDGAATGLRIYGSPEKALDAARNSESQAG